MRTFEEDLLSDHELSEMLAEWRVPEPPLRLRERVFPAKPKLFSRQSRFTAAAFMLQTVAAIFLVTLATSPSVRKAIELDHTFLLYKLPSHTSKAAGGGGGHASQAPRHGEAPKFAPHPFIPPATVVTQQRIVTPAITAQAPQIDALNYGDPLGGVVGGLGAGSGTGIGSGNGNGYGPGSGGGTGGGVYKIGGDVSAPALVSKIEPEYSEEARKAKYSGTVLLSVVIDEHGIPRDIKVVRPLGMGLDEKAIEAVSKWRFRPALKGGKPVSVTANVNVSFRLL